MMPLPSLAASLCALLALTTSPCAQEAPQPLGEAVAANPAADETVSDLPQRDQGWDALLRRHVQDGQVDYDALSADPSALDDYLAALRTVAPETHNRQETLAFWVNAYNAFTLRLILDYLPPAGSGIGGIKEIPSSKRWKAKRWNVGGKLYSLDHIEHAILRKLKEPRVHFVLVCASRSCPDLPAEALSAARLDAQLTHAARRFLADTFKGLKFGSEAGSLWGTNHVVRLSPIFGWFDEDFGGSEDAILDFVVEYAPAAAASFIRAHRDDLDVREFEYDWSLNKHRS